MAMKESVFEGGGGMTVFVGTASDGKPVLGVEFIDGNKMVTTLEPGIALAIANELFLVASGNDKEETP